MIKRARVLIVEDNRIVARDISEQLGRIGHSVIGVTARGESAVDLAISNRPDLVLMDIRLEGEIDGIDAAKQIRAKCQIPVVFLTAYADDETIRRANQAEPFGYLLKPFEDLQLRTVIEMALHKHWADRSLRDSKRRFEATLSSIGDGVIATDAEGYVTFINPVAETMTGCAKSDAIGKPLASIYDVVDGASHDKESIAVQTLSLARTFTTSDRAVLRSRTGLRFNIDETCSPIIDDESAVTGVILVFADKSDQRRAERALQSAQIDLMRMSRITTMGQLTASIAHEVNQPLMAVVMNAEACVNWLSGDRQNADEAKAAAERAVAEGHRAGKIIHRIRAIARNTPVLFESLDVNEMIEGILGMVQPELSRQNIICVTDLQPGRLTVVGDRIQLQQVMLNLISNATDAIKAGRGQDRSLSVMTTMEASGALAITVEDSGVGVDPSHRDMIFDPFFTTKRDGIGMGLSICHTIVEAHGGRLWAEPREPNGTYFRFTLPQCQL